MIGEPGRADADAFLSRLLNLDRTAVVRLRPAAESADLSQLWAMLPFGVLVSRVLLVRPSGDVTVDAAGLLASVRGSSSDVSRRDAAWRWPLPPSRGRVIEVVRADDVRRVAAAAARTLREAAAGGVGGRPVGGRALRDALLDHVPIVVTGQLGERVDVSQRLVQAIVRMGFLGPKVTFGESVVAVRTVGAWIGLDASYGTGWYRPISPLQFARGVDGDSGPFR